MNGMKRLGSYLVLSALLILVVLFSAGAIANYRDRPLYFNRFEWQPLGKPLPQWTRDVVRRDRAGMLALYDERLNHGLILRPRPGSERVSIPMGEPLDDGQTALLVVGGMEIRFPARDRLVVIDDTGRILKSVPIDEASDNELQWLQEAKER